jgi:hypothetical protein
MADIGRTQFKFDFDMLGYQIVSLNDGNESPTTEKNCKPVIFSDGKGNYLQNYVEVSPS